LNVKPVEAMRFDVDAVPVTARFVEVAFVVVPFVVVKLPSVVAPVTPSVPVMERFPALSKVEVAVPPKYALSKTEKRVEDAWMKLDA